MNRHEHLTSGSLKPSLTKRRDVRGRRIVAHVATIGPIQAEGPTPNEAIQNVTDYALAALDRLTVGPRVGHWLGHAYCIAPDVDGWRYWLDFFQGGYFVNQSGTRERCEDAAINHLAQYLWTPEADDSTFLASLPPSLRGELANWIGFQRAYIRERNAGTPEAQIHRIACERPERIAVPV